MRSKTERAERDDELVLALGLVWGHLNARQFEEAYQLAKGCLRVWPEENGLVLMAACAAAEMLEPVDPNKLVALKNRGTEEWIEMVLRRAEIRTDTAAVRAHSPK
jgi:hypothetical protein